MPKIRNILTTSSPQLVQLINQHQKLARTETSTLKARIAQIDRIKKGGPHAPVVRAILKLVVIRHKVYGSDTFRPEFSPLTERCPLSRIATWTGVLLNPASRRARCTKPQMRPELFPKTTDMYLPGFSTRHAYSKDLRRRFW